MQTTIDNPVTISVQPLVIVVRMLGELFDIDKCFLLPKALHNVKELVKLHKGYGVSNVLIVGHTDTSGKHDYNLDLSLERTTAMLAYLTNDADSWLEWYGDDKKQSKRWGTTEDTYMIQTLVDGSSCGPTVLGYQQWHNAKAKRLSGYQPLDEDGDIGPATRMQLILDYMRREDTTVPGGTSIQVHGCGEYFPLDSSGENLDTNAANGQQEQEDRRVEVYLFPRELGVLPPVPGPKATKGEKEYLEWRKRAVNFDLLRVFEADFLRVSVPYDTDVGHPEDYELRVSGGGTLVSKDAIQVGACLIFDLDIAKLPEPCQLELRARDYHELLGEPFSPADVRVRMATGDVGDLDELWQSNESGGSE